MRRWIEELVVQRIVVWVPKTHLCRYNFVSEASESCTSRSSHTYLLVSLSGNPEKMDSQISSSTFP